MPQQDTDTTRCSTTSQDTPAPSVERPPLPLLVRDLLAAWDSANSIEDLAALADKIDALRAYDTVPVIEMHCGMCEHDWSASAAGSCPACGSDEIETLAEARTHNEYVMLRESTYAHGIELGFTHDESAEMAGFLARTGIAKINAVSEPQPERVSLGDTSNTDPSPQTTPPAQSVES